MMAHDDHRHPKRPFLLHCRHAAAEPAVYRRYAWEEAGVAMMGQEKVAIAVRDVSGLRLTPHGRLVLEEAANLLGLDERSVMRLTKAFAESTGRGLLQLGAGEVGQLLPPAFVWWRGFSAQYVGALCLLGCCTGHGNQCEGDDGGRYAWCSHLFLDPGGSGDVC